MKATLVYPASPTNPPAIVDIFEDVKKVNTGSTALVKGDLSATCNQPSTVITATVAGGWTAEAATNLLDVYDLSTVAIPSGTVTDLIFVAGSINLFVACGTNGVSTSPDGKTWTLRDGSSNCAALGVNAAQTLLICVRATAGAATALYSSDGITWTASTTQLTLAVASSIPIRIGTRGTTMFVSSNSNTTIYSTTDGITYTSTTVTSNLYAHASDGTNLISIGQSCHRNTSGTTWAAVTGVPSGSYKDIVWTGTAFVAVGNTGICARSLTGASGTWTQITLPSSANFNSVDVYDYGSGLKILYAVSSANIAIQSMDDGLTWSVRNIPTSMAAITNSGAVTIGGNPGVWCLGAGGVSYVAEKNKTNGLFKAICADGTRYKYLHLDIALSSPTLAYMFLKGYWSFNLSTGIGDNLCYNSDNTIYAQRIDYTNGGALFLHANNRLAYCMSFLSAGSAYGSSSGAGGCGLVEYTSLDGWNTAALGYPTFAWFNTNLTTNVAGSVTTIAFYSPKLQSAVGSNFTGANAVLGMNLKTNAKPSLDGTGAVDYSAVPISLFNSAGTYEIKGGLALGNMYQFTDGVGTMLDEVTIGADSYRLFVAGSTLTTTRLMFPNA